MSKDIKKAHLAFLVGLLTFTFIATAQEISVILSLLISTLLFGVAYTLFGYFGSYISLPFDDGRALALVRILSSALLIYQLIRVHFLNTTSLPTELIIEGTFLSLLQSIPFYTAISTNPTALTACFVITLYVLVFALLGYKAKYTIPAAAICYTVTYGFVLQFFNLWHESILPLTLLFALSCLPAADRFSLDGYAGAIKRKTTGEYSFAFFVVWSVVALTYLSLGASKLLHTGLSWVEPDSVRGHILGIGYRGAHEWSSTFALSGPDTVFLIGGIVVLILQVGYITTLCSKYARIVFPLLGIGFSIAVMIFMHIYFYDLILINFLLLVSTLLYWKKTNARFQFSTELLTPIEKRTQVTLAIVCIVFLTQWHGYVENFPFTSWDMYSGSSQFTESRYKHDGSISRFEAVVHYTDGTTGYFNPSGAFEIYSYPGKCQYRYKPTYYEDCHAFYAFAAKKLEEQTGRAIESFDARLHRLEHDRTRDIFKTIDTKTVSFPLR